METSNQYKKANKIRMKLLLFIDKEIQSDKKNNQKIIQKRNQEYTSLIQFEETFFQNESFHFVEINKIIFDSKMKKGKEKNKKLVSKNDSTPIFKIPQNKGILLPSNFFIHKTAKKEKSTTFLNPICELKKAHSTLFSNHIKLEKKVYSMKLKKKLSSVLEIYTKPKNDKKYLKDLCNNLKRMRPNANRQKSTSFINNLSKSKNTFTHFAATQKLKLFKKNKRGSATCKHYEKIKETKTHFKKKESPLRKFAKKRSSNTYNIDISLVSTKS